MLSQVEAERWLTQNYCLKLNEAIRSKHSIEMEYYSASSGQTNTRTVDPYHLHNIHGDWYLIAYCHTRREPRDFLTSRIKAHKRLLSTFQVAPDFSLNTYLETGFLAERATEPENIVIKFDEYQARWIRERQWHFSQKIEELPSGELILRLRVGGLGEVKRWIMSYGSHAESSNPKASAVKSKRKQKKCGKSTAKSRVRIYCTLGWYNAPRLYTEAEFFLQTIIFDITELV